MAVGALPLPAATLERSARKKSEGEVSKEDVHRAIVIFRRDPLNAQGEMTQHHIALFKPHLLQRGLDFRLR